MANYIKNIITMDRTPEIILGSLRMDNQPIGSIDFNKIVPMPSYIYRGNLGQKEREIYGENNWYDWSRKSWGTKWNAFDFLESDLEHFEFCTAWCGVPRLVQKMPEMFPDTTFSYFYADEDMGFNLGYMEFKNGELIHEDNIEEDSENAYEFADFVWNY